MQKRDSIGDAGQIPILAIKTCIQIVKQAMIAAIFDVLWRTVKNWHDFIDFKKNARTQVLQQAMFHIEQYQNKINPGTFDMGCYSWTDSPWYTRFGISLSCNSNKLVSFVLFQFIQERSVDVTGYYVWTHCPTTEEEKAAAASNFRQALSNQIFGLTGLQPKFIEMLSDGGSTSKLEIYLPP